MHKSEITAVFLAAILFAGAITAAAPTFIGSAEASGDRDKDKDKDRDRNKYKSYDDEYKRDDPKYKDDYYEKEPKKERYYDGYKKDPKKPEYKSYYDESSAYGQESYKKPSYGTDYGKDHDKKIIKKIIVVCPNGKTVPVHDGENMGMQPGTYNFMNGEHNDKPFFHKIIKKFCPPIPPKDDNGVLDCEKCIEWVLNFANNANQVERTLEAIIEAIQSEGGGDDLVPPTFSTQDGLEGSNLWEICEALDELLSDSDDPEQLLQDLWDFLDQNPPEGPQGQRIQALAQSIIECIAFVQFEIILDTDNNSIGSIGSDFSGDLDSIVPDLGVDLPFL